MGGRVDEGVGEGVVDEVDVVDVANIGGGVCRWRWGWACCWGYGRVYGRVYGWVYA